MQTSGTPCASAAITVLCRKEAFTNLNEIYNWFTERFDTADLKDAKALLEELSN
jgi:hypothetical protein